MTFVAPALQMDVPQLAHIGGVVEITERHHLQAQTPHLRRSRVASQPENDIRLHGEGCNATDGHVLVPAARPQSLAVKLSRRPA